MKQVNRIILHCSATPEGRPHDANDIRRWHMAKGWKDVGYHWIIGIDGTIEAGRQMNKRGAHAKGHNKDSIGICYIGGMCQDSLVPKDTLTELQLTALYNVIEFVRSKFGDIPVIGHNEVSNKACPSFNVADKLGEDYVNKG